MVELDYRIRNVLRENEEIIGYVRQIAATLEKPKWIVVTNERIIILDEKMFGRYEIKAIPYNRLKRVAFYKGVLASQFTIEDEENRKTVLDWVNKRNAMKVLDYIKSALSRISVKEPYINFSKGVLTESWTLEKPKEITVRANLGDTVGMNSSIGGPREKPSVTGERDDVLTKLRELKKMLEEGLITEEEFNTIKKKILDEFLK